MSDAVLIAGDCRRFVPSLPEESFDSCVTDPPYSLVSIQKRFGKPGSAPAQYGRDGAYARTSAGFMGQTWDTGEVAHDPLFWAQVLRVLKPGGHVVAMGGTRTYHRLACAIEDAGFELRDMVAFMYAVGFPKSHDIGRMLDAKKKRCSCSAPLRELRSDLGAEDQISGGEKQGLLPGVRESADIENKKGKTVTTKPAGGCGVRLLRQTTDDAAGVDEEGASLDLLQSIVPQQDVRRTIEADISAGAGSNDTGGSGAGNETSERSNKSGVERRGDLSPPTRELCERPLCEVPGGISAHGAEGRLCDGTPADNGKVDRSATSEDRGGSSPRSRPAKQSARKSGALAGQPQPQAGGIWPYCRRCGKPIVPDGLGTALKPAFEPIVIARKPLQGTLAENVLAWGVGSLNIEACRIETTESTVRFNNAGTAGPGWRFGKKEHLNGSDAGRWPANVAHDGSDEVFETIGPDVCRFFFSAKAGPEDRLGSRHPTVKPVSLIRWLMRLVTPPAGTILDPFAGSGTSATAALAEGFDAILIEREEAYIADIKNRLAYHRGDGGHSGQLKARRREDDHIDRPV